MSLRAEQIFAADLTAAIGDYPVKVRWGGVEIDASFNGGKVGIDAVDGGVLIDDNGTILGVAADFPQPWPSEGDTIELRQRDLTWKAYEVAGAVEVNDPKGVGITIVVGPIGKR